MIRCNRSLQVCSLLVLLISCGVAQDPVVDRVFPSSNRDARVPAPSRFLPGFGARYTPYHRAYEYARAVAAASDRVQVEEYGSTVTGRRLMKAVVTTPDNHASRGATRTCLRSLVEGKRDDVGDQPVTVWCGMSIHGDEGSGVEAGIALLYHLASDQGPRTKALLGNAILIIDVCTNPDGRARFVEGVIDRQSLPAAENAQAWDHAQPWPGGRTNHYLFDLNRDWYLQTQEESRARALEFRKDLPQVLADCHEMGADSSYYFSTPPGQPVNEHVTEQVRKGWKLVGGSIVKAFDERKWPYWVGDVFPADFPGYGGSWPSLQGSIGMTFEQASSRGGRIRRRDGDVLTLEQAMAHHATACLATLAAAAGERHAVLERFRDHFKAVAREGQRDGKPWIVLTPRHDADGLLRLGRTLQRNGIRVRSFKSAATLEAEPLEGGAAASVTVPAGTLAVSTRQPLRPLLLALVDPRVNVEASFLEAEKQRREKGQRSQVYDVSAWNLPLLFGVESFRAAQVPEDHLQDGIRKPAATPASVPDAAVALLVPGHRLQASALLSMLLAREIPVEVTPFEFTVHDRAYTRGTLVVRTGRLDDRARGALDMLLRNEGLGSLVRPALTFRTDTGKDLGSQRIRPVRQPKIVVACGDGTSANSFGAVRWLFERGLTEGGGEAVAHVSVPLGTRLSRALEEANVLVLPDGRGYQGKIEKKLLEGFLARGGTVVALRGAVGFLASKEMGLLPLKTPDAAQRRKLGSAAGPIIAATLDEDHWLGWGLPRKLHVQVRTASWWKPVEKDAARVVVALATKKGGPPDVKGGPPAWVSSISGLLPGRQARALAGAPVVVEKTHGRGRVVGFTEDVVFRGATPGLWKLFLNACLLGPSMGR